MPQSSEHIPNIPTGIIISVIVPFSSITVSVILIPSLTNFIVLPSNSNSPPVPPFSESYRDSAMSLDSCE